MVLRLWSLKKILLIKYQKISKVKRISLKYIENKQSKETCKNIFNDRFLNNLNYAKNHTSNENAMPNMNNNGGN